MPKRFNGKYNLTVGNNQKKDDDAKPQPVDNLSVLIDKIDRCAAVIGIGYVGLSLMLRFVEAGF